MPIEINATAASGWTLRAGVARVLRPAILSAACLLGTVLSAQTAADYEAIVARLDRLSAQVNALSTENAELRQQLGAPTAPGVAAAPAPRSNFRLIGELRLRYDNLHGANRALVDDDTFALRLRAGAIAQVGPNLELGLRLTNGTGGADVPGQNASKKTFALDLAFARWTPVRNDTTSLAFIGGKMDNPLVLSDMAFHGDITPEGVAGQFSHRLDARHTLGANAGVFVLHQPGGGASPALFTAAQVRVDSAWNGGWSTSFGLTALDVSHAALLTNTAVPDGTKGNTRTADGRLVNSYHPWAIDASVTRLVHGLPVRLAGNFMVNPGADRANQAYDGGIFVGRADKQGAWEFNYRYRVVQADAWYEELVHPDFGGYYESAPAGGAAGYAGGTNVGGHVFGATYALSDNATLGFTYFAQHLLKASPAGSESSTGRLQVDTNIRF